MYGLKKSDCNWPLALFSVALAVLCFAAPRAALAKSHALIVGVGVYAFNPKNNLAGPPQDALAVRDVLVRRWGFAPADVRMLVDQEATKKAIIAELKAMALRSREGDDIVVYLSGHGTSAVDSAELVPLPYGSGAFLPHDFDLSSPEKALASALVGRTDLLPLYKTLSTGGRRLWVISDSCYSGNQVRSIGDDPTALPGRFIPAPIDREKQRADGEKASVASAPLPWPYKGLSFLSASAEGEVARDIPPKLLAKFPTLDGKPHGAMTDALLRVLGGEIGADYNGDGQLSLIEAHRAVGQFMASRGYGHTPVRLPNVAEDDQGQASQALIRSVGMGKVSRPIAPGTAPLKVLVDGSLQGNSVETAFRQSGVARVQDRGQADAILQLTSVPYRLLLPSGDLLASWASQASEGELGGAIAQLALDKRWHQLAQQTSKGILNAEVVPGIQGGNVRIGQKIHFSVRPELASTLLLVNINAKGQVTTLYPTRSSEMAPLAAGGQKAIPGSAPNEQIDVQLPLGMDIQFAFAFEQPPAKLDRLMGFSETPADHPSLALLDQILAEQKGRFSFARMVLRTSP